MKIQLSKAQVSTWLRIVRLGLVQAALGGTVAFCTYTLNRIMVVEFMLPAIVPGALVAWHYALQVLRPRLGHGSDVGGRRTPWIVGGMLVLAAGAVGATAATCMMGAMPVIAIVLAALSFTAIGVGVGAAGTSNLVLLAKQVDASHRAAGSAIVWITMIVGIVLTAAVAGHLLEPFSLPRLMQVGSGVAGVALLVGLAAVWKLESCSPSAPGTASDGPGVPPRAFRTAVREVWADPRARRFTFFVFVSMLAFNAQELLLEPFSGSVFNLSPGASTKLIGVQHQGVLIGMLLFGLGASLTRGARSGDMRPWAIGGCLGSALLIGCLAISGLVGPDFPLWPCVVVLGVANGIFTVAAVGSMMQLAAAGAGGREGVRMGTWGAAQAIAAALGGLFGTGASDLARRLLGSPTLAYAAAFALEALLFAVAALLAARAFAKPAANSAARIHPLDRRVSMAGGSPEPHR